MAPALEETHSLGAAPDPMLPAPWRIEQVRKETADTFTLSLNAMNAVGPLEFAAGQFNMLYLFGVGEVPISISGNPLAPSPLVHTLRAVGGVTKAMAKLKTGDAIGVRGPYGFGWPLEQAVGRDLVIAAGGIGFAPLRSVIYHALARRHDFGEIVLLLGARSPQDICFKGELRRWAARCDLQVHLTVDHVVGRWRGNVGVVTKLIPQARFDPANTIALMCGPEVMMRFTALALQKRGMPFERMFVSLERNMRCAVGFCGHCQFGPTFISTSIPVSSS